ncbi:O-methyltransferase [Paenibacillus sp. UNC499MF]|uniref:O-methyltransferase n=1 Tax=Paenibacillus sp. UNC499MF TaxID=1502751 RepID=UPI00089FAE4D|nr:O-methyltransferase [Paenibacillus sp. UNC499MF]SEG67949.1 Predicted O-methyltransferase YrrM [Paenibacillus sp. UNC499MF]
MGKLTDGTNEDLEKAALGPEQYLEALYAEDEALELVKEAIRANNMPDISVAPGYGRLLTMLVRLTGARQVLEIGALGGYSAICLARGLDDGGKVLSLEVNAAFAETALENVTKAGFGDKVGYRVADASESLAALKEEGAKFDFFFIDADKVNYPAYLDYAIELANPGAIIIGDNILMRGRTIDAAVTKKSVEAMREFNRRFASDPRLESTMLPAYDGLAVARVK